MGTVQTIGATLLALTLVGVVTVLAWHGTLDGQAVIGFLSGVTLAGAAGFAHNAGVKSGQAATAVALQAAGYSGSARLIPSETLTAEEPTGRRSR